MEDGSVHRFATLAPGMILGEIAMISNRPPLGSFRVDTDVAAYSLWILLAACGWLCGFTILALRLIPLLLKARVDGKEH